MEEKKKEGQKEGQKEDNKRMLKERQAEKLAEFIHCGQKRKNGEPYIEHPRRVAKDIKELGYDGDVVCASWLHDTEDFQFLGEMFRIIDNIFGYRVYGLVLLLSHIPKDTPYNNYIYKIAEISEEAMAIKWQDMIDNTNDNPPKRQWEKYRNACLFLLSKEVEVPEILMKRLRIT
jgi:(p)ppGpp synthase/HD superfamily hydrolase